MIDFCYFLPNFLIFAVFTLLSFQILRCLFNEICAHILSRRNLKLRLNSYGRWAAVTGCTRGLGLEYCKQLAQFGLNIILIGRNEKLLKQLATDLHSLYSVETCVVEVDFDNVDEKNFDKVCQTIKNKDIGILVNNAGVMYDFPDQFHNVSELTQKRLLTVNICWPVRLSHFIIKEVMLPKNNGLVVFMSSAAGKGLTPMLSAYGASKAYIMYLTKALSLELLFTGVKVQVVHPFYIATDMTSYNKHLNSPGFLNPDAKTFAKNAIRTFGATTETFGYFPHTLQYWSLCWMPDCVYSYIALFWNKLLKHKRSI